MNEELLREILVELRAMNARMDRIENDVRGVKVNWSHPVLKLIARGNG